MKGNEMGSAWSLGHSGVWRQRDLPRLLHQEWPQLDIEQKEREEEETGRSTSSKKKANCIYSKKVFNAFQFSIPIPKNTTTTTTTKSL